MEGFRTVPYMLAKIIKKYMKEIFIDAGLDFDKDKDSVVFAVPRYTKKYLAIRESIKSRQ